MMTTETAKHTPTYADDQIVRQASDGLKLCYCRDRQTAKRIAAALNSHEALVEALTTLLAEANDDGITRRGVDQALGALEAAGVDTRRFGR